MYFLSSFLRIVAQRALSEGERALIFEVFGNAIDVSRVKIFASNWVKSGYAIAPNGYIYFSPQQYLQDYSCASLTYRAWFIHEMTHVWQFQRGKSVFWRALLNRQYDYVLKEGKSFLKYGIEQQAQMVQDLYIQREKGLPCQKLQACVPFYDQKSNI